MPETNSGGVTPEARRAHRRRVLCVLCKCATAAAVSRKPAHAAGGGGGTRAAPRRARFLSARDTCAHAYTVFFFFFINNTGQVRCGTKASRSFGFPSTAYYYYYYSADDRPPFAAVRGPGRYSPVGRLPNLHGFLSPAGSAVAPPKRIPPPP